MPLSPLAPKTMPIMPAIKGVKLAAAACGIKYKDRTDVMIAELSQGTTVAGMLTTSKTASANIWWARDCLPTGTARVLLVNSGNSNAFNGKAGEESVARIVTHVAKEWQCSEQEIYPCATGVIGQPLPDNKITDAIATLKSSLNEDGFEAAAHAIMTTDTFAKYATRSCMISGKEITINGIAKGSGMIAPDMATMLSYIFTDAAIEAPTLQSLFADSVEKSFNRITVDSDTSTSDTALIFATGKAGNTKFSDANSKELASFKEALDSLLLELAHLIVKDGEGATKFIEIKVGGAENDHAAKKIALSIANSPLVKTAIAGEDANWGRIVMAVGKSGEAANRDRMEIRIGNILIVKDGQLNPDYKEAEVTTHMKGHNIIIFADAGTGKKGEATVWTCDLTYEYIRINADYRS